MRSLPSQRLNDSGECRAGLHVAIRCPKFSILRLSSGMRALDHAIGECCSRFIGAYSKEVSHNSKTQRRIYVQTGRSASSKDALLRSDCRSLPVPAFVESPP